MPTDLVFPQGNEQKLVEMALKLGFTRLILCYPLSDPGLKSRKDEVAKLGIDAVFAVYVDRQDDIPKAQRFTHEIVARGAQGIYDDRRVKYVIGFESSRREDFIHHRNSGLNQVFIQAAIKTGKTILVDVSQLLAGEQDVVLGRVLQNNMFFRKYKPDVLVVSGAREALDMRAPRDMADLLRL